MHPKINLAIIVTSRDDALSGLGVTPPWGGGVSRSRQFMSGQRQNTNRANVAVACLGNPQA